LGDFGKWQKKKLSIQKLTLHQESDRRQRRMAEKARYRASSLFTAFRVHYQNIRFEIILQDNKRKQPPPMIFEMNGLEINC
jgi:hypothetical protein